ncbi:DUF6090 family protein [Aestuariivivens sediminis]|uniref:DUF6090 family protein n=1 Tax=Aestuariivivens sediminis TaxID=2913557 RepID=UPI001F58750C|nr:DUF6090 family protein [Aestuariivivens sediminis]
MIKFFRKIRQKLLTENKFSKYLLYAIGEIMLVVIGILIALQINNWNESNKEEKIRVSYYQQLLSDLEFDKNNFKETILIFEREFKKIEDSRKFYAKPDLSIAEIFDNMFKNNFFPYGIEYKSSTIETLISTGDINIFNPKLRGLLTQYNKSIIEAKNTYSANMDDAIELLKEAAIKGSAVVLRQKEYRNQSQLKQMLTIEKRYPDIYIALEAYFFWKRNVYRNYAKDLKQKIDQSNDIIEIIKTLLKK